VEIENTSVLNEQLMPLASDMYTFKKQLNGLNYNTSPANRKAKVDSLFMKLALIEKKYDTGFRQLFVEKKLEINLFKLISIFPEIPSPTPEQLNEFFSGKNFLDFFEENLKLLQELNPKSYLLEGNFLQNLYLMKTLIKDHPDVLLKYNLSKNYFDDFAENFINNSPNERLCCNLLFNLAKMQIYENEDKAKVLLDKLKQYPYEKYVSKESVSQLYATLNLKIGKYAPDFTIKTLAGSNINLSAFKGKFVFLDFWGSWCAPCLRETPYIKKLYSNVSREKLEIIGLAQDKEEPLRKYITENEIEYPNALASPSLLSEYGIRSYPTSFLINPDGKIVRMNMRGEAELNLIAEEIERYFK
jgi:peroxiredoxin